MKPRQHWAVLLIAAIFVVLGLLRLNDLSLYTDSTRYLIWGNSIAHLKGYVDDTQPVPTRFVMNAPLYPLLLAPVEIVFPLSLEAAKIWTLLWGVAAILLLYSWLRRYFGNHLAVFVILLFAFNPLVLTLSTEVLSEAPFIALTALLLLSFDVYRENPGDRFHRLVLYCGLAAASLLREVGAAYVLASLVLMFRLKRGRDLAIVGFSAGALFLLWTIRNSVMTEQSGQAANVQYLFGHFVTSPHASMITEFASRIWLNLKGYVVNVGGQILFPFPETLIVGTGSLYHGVRDAAAALRIPLAVIIFSFSVLGVRTDLRSSPSAFWRLLVSFFYCAIILVYPVHDVRFLLPLLPLILFYTVRGSLMLGQMIRNVNVRTGLAACALAVLFLPNVVAVYELVRTNLAYRSAPEEFSTRVRQTGESAAYYDQPWSALGAWIRTNIPEHVTIASPAKEALPYLGKRLLLETSRVLPTPVFERTIRDFNTQFLISTRVFDDFQTFEFDRLESQRLRFKPLYSVAGLTVYEVRSSVGAADPHPAAELPDSSSVRGLLLQGRLALQNLHYHNALALFSLAFQREPSQPEIAYQLMTTLAVLGDSVGATRMNEKLFTLPQSTAYSLLAQAQLGAMGTLLQAQRPANAITQAFTAFEAGLAYWGLGYPRIAFTVMGNVVKKDSTNFVGALWSTYMAQQLGDTTASNRYLARLIAIDRTASIVLDWTAIRNFQNALRTKRAPAERSRLHLRIAAVYLKIELFDDALDEVERSLKDQPGGIDALLFCAEVFEKKGARVGARNAYEEVLKLEPGNPFARAKLDSLAD